MFRKNNQLFNLLILASILLTTALPNAVLAQEPPDTKEQVESKQTDDAQVESSIAETGILDLTANGKQFSLTAIHSLMNSKSVQAPTAKQINAIADNALFNQLFAPTDDTEADTSVKSESEEVLNQQLYLPFLQFSSVGLSYSNNVANAASMDAINTPNATDAAIFARLARPNGVVTDWNNNVFVTSDATFSTLLTKFSANGTPVAQTQIGNAASIFAIGRMDIDTKHGVIWDLFSNGTGVWIAPDTNQIVGRFDLRNLQIDTTSVYDVLSNQVVNLSGSILPSRANYGDIAILQRDNTLDVFISGLSVTLPFVMRLRIAPSGYSAKVLVTSRASAAPTNNVPRGIAVNKNGIVLTTLPLAASIGAFDRAFAFSADFPEQGGTGRPTILFNGEAFTSRGMTTDPNGNFYVASGLIGISSCGANGSGSLVGIPADLRGFQCLTFGGILSQTLDVAIDTRGSRAYVTQGNGAVIAVP